MEYYSAIKNEILSFVTTWINLESIMLSEISQIDRDKYHMISLVCGIYKKNQPIKPNRTKQTHTFREQMNGCQKGGHKGCGGNR